MVVCLLFQSAKHLNGVIATSLKESALKTEPSALMYKLPTAYHNGQSLTGARGVLAHLT